MSSGKTTWEIGAPTRPLIEKPARTARTHTTLWTVFSRSGTLSVSSGTSVWEWPMAVTIMEVRLAVGTAPTGASLIVDVMKNGSSIFTAPNRPTILAGAFTGSSSAIATPDGGPGDLYKVDIDQVGSSVAGSDLTVVLVI